MADPGLESELRALRDDLRTARQQEKKLARIGQGLTIVLIIVFVGFVATLYNKVVAAYSPRNFEGPLQEEAQNFLPKLEPELRILWDETAPVYGQLASEKLEMALPALQDASRREFDALLFNLQTSVNRQAYDALDRIALKHQKRLEQQFPKLSSPEEAEALGDRWLVALEGDFKQVASHVTERFAEDILDVEMTLRRFLPNEFEDMSEEELARQFIHLWLMKVDRMVLHGNEGRSYRQGGDHVE